VVAAAVASAAAFSCRPEPGLGSIALARRGALHVVDLATCRDRIVGPSGPGLVSFGRGGNARIVPPPAGITSPNGRLAAHVRVSRDWWTIVVREGGTSREIYRVTRHYRVVTDDTGPIELLGWSGDSRWLLFVIDPDGSGSIQADGLTLRAVSLRGGKPIRVARMLVYRDYLTWCGNRLVFTAGRDRIATNRKRLMSASPPRWKPQPLVALPRRSWGSIACVPGGRSLVAQSQPTSTNPSFFATHWSLWRVSLDGTARQLTSPPSGFADESPRLSRDGKSLLFVRSHKGRGKLYTLRGRRLVGPLLSFGNNLGYYGHHDWWRTAAWSAAR